MKSCLQGIPALLVMSHICWFVFMHRVARFSHFSEFFFFPLLYWQRTLSAFRSFLLGWTRWSCSLGCVFNSGCWSWLGMQFMAVRFLRYLLPFVCCHSSLLHVALFFPQSSWFYSHLIYAPASSWGLKKQAWVRNSYAATYTNPSTHACMNSHTSLKTLDLYGKFQPYRYKVVVAIG